MGWQGRMRDAKGRRIFTKIPEMYRRHVVFEEAHCWRDDSHCWITVRDEREGSRKTLRVNRSTGLIEPVAGAGGY